MEAIKKGTVESLIVVLKDRLENLEDISAVGDMRFFVHKKEDDSLVQPDSVPAFDAEEPMWAICPIDTTLAAYEANKEYKLYVKYTAGSEAPVLGPENFRVVSD